MNKVHRKGTLLLVGLIIAIALVELFIFNQEFVHQKFSKLEERQLSIESGTLYQLHQENNKIISNGVDPSITFENLNIQLHSIYIDCKNALFGASGQIFFQSGNQPFSDANSIVYNYARVSGYENTIYLPQTQFVSKLRVDVTNLNDDVLVCQDFVINPRAQLHLTFTRLTLYACLLIFVALEFFGGFPFRRSFLRNFSLSSFLLKLSKKIPRTQYNKKILFLLVGWLLLWLVPWAIWADALPWVRLVISLFVFVFPGMLISILLAGTRFDLTGHFSYGVAFSVFLAGTLGFTGRIFHWSFENVKNLFALSGLIAILALTKYSAFNRHLYKPTRFSGRTLILLLFMIVFGVIANFQSRHSGDDLSYLAYITSWQHSQGLDFREVTYGAGTMDSIRFWWGMFPMSLALLAEVSHLHGLLLVGFYLEPFLITIAILALYHLYEDLLSSQNQAIVAVLLQFTSLFLLRQIFQPGYMFFERMSDDKVFAAFVLAPVFFTSVRYFINSFHLRSGLLFLLSGLSLALTHPVILAYSVFIAGVYSVNEIALKKDYTKLFAVSILLVLIIAPSASLRFIDETSVSQSVFGLEPGVTLGDSFNLESAQESPSIEGLISSIEGTSFYGFNLDRIRIAPNGVPENPLLIVLSWSYLGILGLGFIWSLFNLKKDVVAPFITATSLLVFLCAIPYTGWLAGYFVSARMLWRAPWTLPVGLISFTLLRGFFNAVRNKISTNVQSRIKIKAILYTWIPLACLILVTYFSETIYQYQWLSTKGQLNDYRNSLGRLSGLGNYIENHIDQPSRFIAPLSLMNYLPSLSSKSKVVLLRYTAWAPYPVDINEIDNIFSDDPSISIEQRIQLLDKYNVQYVLFENSILKDYYVRNLNLFNTQYINGYWLVKFRE